MRIVNQTHWRSDHLRAFVTRIAADELTPEQRKKLKVTFVYTRRKGSTYSSGWAYYHGSAKIRLSPQTPDKIDLAHVIAHELAHTRGMKHDAMKGDPRYERSPRTREIYAWAEYVPLEQKEVKATPRPGPEKKLTACQSNLNFYEGKLKRIANVVKKWRKKVKYYETRLAKAAIGANKEASHGK